MSKLYLIHVHLHTTQAELGLMTYMAQHKKQYILGSLCWLILSNNSAEQLRNEISGKIGREDIAFVAEIASAPAYSMHSNPLARWLPRVLPTLN